MDKQDDTELALHDETGALLMLNKEERRLLKALLAMTLKSKNARSWIEKTLGEEYVTIGERLLKTMGGN
jgi:hypothetical protein